MTLTLSLTPELEQYLAHEAKEQGLSIEAYTPLDTVLLLLFNF
jgi:hypothetical protein